MRHLWTVTPQEANQRLGSFITEKLGAGYSSKQTKRWIDANLCEVNGETERFASRKLRAGERVVLHMPAQTNASPARLEVIFQDTDLVVINKPAGITCEALQKGEAKALHLVHRLDKDTSGILVLARNAKAQQAMELLFRERAVHKTYLALVVGAPKASEGTLQSYLGKVHSFEGQSIYGPVSDGSGKYAETAWRVLARKKGCALIACFPTTGRTHQLRAHLKELGCPILGDYQYARQQQAPVRPTRQMLHAWKISFPLPSTGTTLELVAPLPSDFQQTLSLLQISV
jgi:RluA family pseudouridine synthase